MGWEIGAKATALSDAGASERENRAGMGFRLKGRKSGRNLFSLLLIPTTHAEVNEKRKKHTHTQTKSSQHLYRVGVPGKVVKITTQAIRTATGRQRQSSSSRTGQRGSKPSTQ